MTLPGRGPKTPEERQADAIRSQPTRSGDGLILTRGQGKRAEIQPQRAQASGGGVVGTVYYEAPAPAMGWQDFNTTPAITGDGSWAAYDSGSGGVIVTADGYYQGNAFAQIINIFPGNTGRLKFSVPSLGFLEAFATDVDAAGLSITGPVRFQSAGDLFEVNTSLPSGSSGSPATDTDLCWITLTRFG